MNVVLDTNILVAGLRSRHGASNAVLRLVATRRLVPLCSTALFLEYETVLLRPEQQLAHGLRPAAIEQFLAAFAAAALPVELHFRWRPQLQDPADEMVLETAVNGRPHYLVTHNERHFRAAADRFGIKLQSPGTLLKELNR